MSKLTFINVEIEGSNEFVRETLGGILGDAMDVPQLKRGQVWCKECGNTQKVDSSESMRNGWPKCCGYTMTIDSPEERKRLEAKR